MARPPVHLPPGAKTHLENMAADGLLSESAAARALGLSLDRFRRIIRDDPKSTEVWQTALAVERDSLLTALYDKAVSGDVNAARTLLATRHGMSERTVDNGQDRQPSVHIHLPAAMDANAYAKAITTHEQLENGSGGDK